jgi:hypothetical protein
MGKNLNPKKELRRRLTNKGLSPKEVDQFIHDIGWRGTIWRDEQLACQSRDNHPFLKDCNVNWEKAN